MAYRFKSIVSALLLVMLPAIALADSGPARENLSTQIMALSIFNGILFITSLISIIQFFLKDGHNRTPFHAFNIMFVILFYGIGLSFLIHHKEYFEGFEHLSDQNAIIKYFLDKDIISWIKLLIPVAFILNIIYVLKNARSYYLE
ncbi:hypothetical protein CJD36_008640 [Flavipsychrobacter stenotrophus]|uniref:Uncharacterized protein n=1 Tax=Flavipsychrobacter stenotrophus TaxID=2077091 RepID=A0A2S7SZ15_9BACT|nr:hypothetical protein [Flavipsychrobacter stenotrophus]PQJ11851.1 hypothetical protein CJD36_008640 [Flavipsychrobacter stenotrophus]